METTATSERSEDEVGGTAVTLPIRLIVCLGNPGEEYRMTRHNTGFRVGDEILSRAAESRLALWQPGNGELYDIVYGGRQVMLLKPMTYMNYSGEAVVRVVEQFGLSPSELLVISDCLDLPTGRLRLRERGSAGGQKGLRSILDALATTAVPRLRVGIGRPQSSECDIVRYVLTCWTSTEGAVIERAIARAADCVALAIQDGCQHAMNAVNALDVDKDNAKEQGVP